ncbi:unnamed protein product [Amoebophrya sp. A25]|nr:unnamed protein product [Amoebophrya sp. A25]|eukprot:GSA25T00017321001.1
MFGALQRREKERIHLLRVKRSLTVAQDDARQRQAHSTVRKSTTKKVPNWSLGYSRRTNSFILTPTHSTSTPLGSATSRSSKSNGGSSSQAATSSSRLPRIDEDRVLEQPTPRAAVEATAENCAVVFGDEVLSRPVLREQPFRVTQANLPIYVKGKCK